MNRRRRSGALFLVPLLAVTAFAAGCSADAAGAAGDPPRRLRLGFFPNVTHAPAIVGIESGLFAERLGRTQLVTQAFGVGTAVVEALFAGGLDAAFVGPGPAVNGYVQSRGRALRVVAGSTSGGAALVVRRGITSAAQLRGTTIASPGRGNTQDVALRSWLADHGMRTTLDGDGDVTVLPQENAQSLETFRAGAVDGAWVPEPWATRLVVEGGGVVLVDERSLWPGGRFVTAHLVVRADFLRRHPAAVRALVEAELAALALIDRDPARAQQLTVEGIANVTGKRLDAGLVAAAWDNLEFTSDPIAASLVRSARHAQRLGLLPADAGLDGIHDLTILNQALAAAGQSGVPTP